MKNERIKNILYSRLMSFVICFSILLSYCYVTNNIYIKSTILALSILFSCIIYIFYLFNGKISTFNITFILYCVVIFISTLFNKEASIIHYCYAYFRIIAMFFYLDYGLKYSTKNTVNSLYIVLYILTFLNFVSIILFPNGLYSTVNHNNNWFFNYDNAHIFMYFPTLLLLYIRRELGYSKNIFDIVLYLIITFSIVYCFSATSIVGYGIFIFYILFRKYFDKYKVINSKSSFILYILCFVAVVILKVQNIFSYLIVNILGKDLTFSNRTVIWHNTIEYIKDNFLIGYGKEYRYLVAKKLGRSTFTHAHNTILDVLYKGGIIGTFLFMYLISIVIRNMYKYKDNKLTKIMSVMLMSVFLMMNFEARNENIGFYLILIFCNNIKYYI